VIIDASGERELSVGSLQYYENYEIYILKTSNFVSHLKEKTYGRRRKEEKARKGKGRRK